MSICKCKDVTYANTPNQCTPTHNIPKVGLLAGASNRESPNKDTGFLLPPAVALTAGSGSSPNSELGSVDRFTATGSSPNSDLGTAALAAVGVGVTVWATIVPEAAFFGSSVVGFFAGAPNSPSDVSPNRELLPADLLPPPPNKSTSPNSDALGFFAPLLAAAGASAANNESAFAAAVGLATAGAGAGAGVTVDVGVTATATAAAAAAAGFGGSAATFLGAGAPNSESPLSPKSELPPLPDEESSPNRLSSDAVVLG